MPPSPQLAYISLGTNLGRRARNLSLAAMRLALLPRIELLRLSAVYETEPWGLEDQPPFLNMALTARVSLAPHELLREIKMIEVELGRRPSSRWGPRVIDIDILALGNLRMSTPDLTIPHPRIAQRQFVLVPLAEIAPEFEVTEGICAADLARPEEPGIHRIGPLARALEAEA